jgi:pimeloyl-ACP methyl ester carboxylesterase
MNWIFKPIFKTANKLGLAITLLTSACTRCPKSEIDEIYARIPKPDTKNRGFDLKGWTYEKAVSPKTDETYYYYHHPSKKENAPVFVLVHGLFLDGRTFINFGPLADSFELMALELPYESSFYRGKKSDFPELLQDFLDTLKLSDIYLGGVSLGGQIAMLYAELTPKAKIRGLALISTDMTKTKGELRRATRGAKAISKLTRGDDGKMLCILSKLARRQKKNATQESERAFEIFSIKHPSFYREVLSIAYDMKTVPRIDLIDAPAIVVHGDEDSTIPIRKARALAEMLPNATFHTIEGGEHTMAYTRGEVIAEMIKDHFVE